MASLIRSEHFKAYCLKMYVEAHATQGVGEQVAKDKFKDTYYDDFVMLSWIIENIYPNTRRVGEEYEFITNEMTHVDIKIASKECNVGKMTLKVSKAQEFVFFENKQFRHGQIRENGTFTCYGGYRDWKQNVVLYGFSGALMETYNFARASDHNTLVNGVPF